MENTQKNDQIKQNQAGQNKSGQSGQSGQNQQNLGGQSGQTGQKNFNQGQDQKAGVQNPKKDDQNVRQ